MTGAAVFAAGLSLLAFAASYEMTVPLGRSLFRRGLYSSNYLGREVPVGVGVAFLIPSLAAYTLLAFSYPALVNVILPLAIAIVLAGVGGFVDDAAGGQEAKGIKGHIRELLKGRITAGGCKAIGLLLSALVMWDSLVPEDPMRGLTALPLLPLCANTINLTDLRPGRAGKAFSILMGACLLGALVHGKGALSLFTILALPVAGAVAGYLPHDLAGKVMMGDTGANPLGIVIGALLVITAPLPWLAAFIIALLALQIWAERGSLTSLIDAHPRLRFLDSLGRSED